MTRKRFVKLYMSQGISRNQANRFSRQVHAPMKYEIIWRIFVFCTGIAVIKEDK